MNGIKVSLEIGHESTLKAKQTKDGYTHDWELFVRSCHQSDISYFIDKVVFNLHESFAKPKRAIKEPPYVVKESGYAGFEVIIDIYVKNRDEPKKISFHYDMDLQNSGPSICRTQTFSHTFINPTEEFRRKLLKGGGVNVYNTSLVNNFDEKSRERTATVSGIASAAATQPPAGTGVAMNSGSNGDVGIKSSGKHKSAREQPVNSEFANLFGTPITKTTATGSTSLKVSPDPKAQRKTSPNRAAATGSSGGKNSSSSSSGGKGEKGSISGTVTGSSSKDKSSSSSSSFKYGSGSRHTSNSPHVDRGDKFERGREEKGNRKERNRSRERDGGKGAVVNSTSNNNNNIKDKSQKRRPSSPKHSPTVGTGSNKSKSPSRGSAASDYQSTKGGGSSATVSGGGSGSAGKTAEAAAIAPGSGSKKSSKKEKKDKSHDKERGATTASVTSTGNSTATTTTSTSADHQSRDQQPQSKKDRESGKQREGSSSSNSKGNDVTGNKYSTGKEGNPSGSREDKSSMGVAAGNAIRKDDKRGLERDLGLSTTTTSLDASKRHKHKKKDKNKGKDSVQSPASQLAGAKGALVAVTTPPNAIPSGSSGGSSSGGAKEKRQRENKTKDSNSPAGVAKSTIANSEKSEDNAFGYNSSTNKMSNSSNLSDSEESLAEPLLADEAYGNKSKKVEKVEKRKRKVKDELSDSPNKMEPPQKLPRKQAPPSEEGYLSKNGESQENNNVNSSFNPAMHHLGMTETEYIQELKVLQHKIMALQDSNSLQQVVEIIAVTGLYEITEATRTFDFDLCVLNADTVQRLKDFFHTRITKR